MAERFAQGPEKETQTHSKKKHSFQGTHSFKKRPPPKEPKKKNNIYITNKSNFKGQLKQCEELINKGEKEIVLHGLGAALRRTLNLALQVEEKYCGMFKLDVQTSSVKIIDDYEPLTEGDDYETGTRINSAVTVRLFAQDPPLEN